MIDFHSHILPHVDHGSNSFDEAKAQLSLVKMSGVETIVATPHFYPHAHNIEDFLSSVNAAAERLSALKAEYQGLRVCLGAEVLVCDALDKMPSLESLCIRGTNILLLEMPSATSWSRYIQSVENILDAGYTVVLAHIDRYMPHYAEGIDKLLRLGARAQINADSLVSLFSRKKLMPYIEGGAVYAIGSDLHGADKKDYKSFVGVEKKIGTQNFEMIQKFSAELLRNAESIF